MFFGFLKYKQPELNRKIELTDGFEKIVGIVDEVVPKSKGHKGHFWLRFESGSSMLVMRKAKYRYV